MKNTVWKYSENGKTKYSVGDILIVFTAICFIGVLIFFIMNNLIHVDHSDKTRVVIGIILLIPCFMSFGIVAGKIKPHITWEMIFVHHINYEAAASDSAEEIYFINLLQDANVLRYNYLNKLPWCYRIALGRVIGGEERKSLYNILDVLSRVLSPLIAIYYLTFFQSDCKKTLKNLEREGIIDKITEDYKNTGYKVMGLYAFTPGPLHTYIEFFFVNRKGKAITFEGFLDNCYDGYEEMIKKFGRMFKKADSAQAVAMAIEKKPLKKKDKYPNMLFIGIAMLAVSIPGLIYSIHNDLSVIFNIICYQLILIGFGLIAGYLSSRSRR